MPHDHYKPMGRWHTKNILEADGKSKIVNIDIFAIISQFMFKMEVDDNTPRFDEIDDDELEMIRACLLATNMKKTEKKCERCLISYLQQKGKPIDCWHYEEHELDKVLGSFGLKLKLRKERDMHLLVCIT